MEHRRIRGAAVGALALLLVGGAGFVAAASPVRHAKAAAEATSPDGDNVQEGDQTTPDAPAAPVEATTPDGDNVQEGDQGTPDAPAAATGWSQGSLASPMSVVSAVSASKPVVTTVLASKPAAVSKAAKVATAAKAAKPAAARKTAGDPGTENPETNTETEAPSDGPGGHEDPAGQNVDHQFQGEE